MRYMKIGELAKEARCQVETIRYYERKGLLGTPARSDANYRLYGAEHAERLRFIRHCRSLDMRLEEIRTLLKFRDAPERDCAEVNRLLDEHIARVAGRIEELKELERQLKRLRKLCASVRSARECGILRGLAAAGVGSSTAERRGGMHGAHARSRDLPKAG